MPHERVPFDSAHMCILFHMFVQSKTTVLKFRGMPWNTTELEVKYFLEPLEAAGGMEGIKIIRDEEGELA